MSAHDGILRVLDIIKRGNGVSVTTELPGVEKENEDRIASSSSVTCAECPKK